MGACVSHVVDGINRIDVDSDKCIACGACFDVCEHHAREFADDTERFFEDLKKRPTDITFDCAGIQSQLPIGIWYGARRTEKARSEPHDQRFLRSGYYYLGIFELY